VDMTYLVVIFTTVFAISICGVFVHVCWAY